ncbi:sperm axonemal maintenance protein CFAP97D1-like [Polyodon spathula]|uniref:sperm axonemal maintenance protein CFAP97D1-like n=1 Tax=Polyodon spathula TaxID=7913 RepID=UPI001B7F5BA1|nr:sperm axonemal maintenance protein CFAP97D1-like [Polyodon spathula]
MMHRAYQPVLPCGNKYLQEKWDKTYYDEHRKKVKSAKPMVNTTTPQTYGHLHLKMKKLKLEEERLSTIERDNSMLLEKMSNIMRTRGRIDNKNDYENKSLNREKRQQELLRVTRENHNILERLSSCGPQYSVKRWHEDWQRNEKYMENIARYPRSCDSARHIKNKSRAAGKTNELNKHESQERGGKEGVEGTGNEETKERPENEGKREDGDKPEKGDKHENEDKSESKDKHEDKQEEGDKCENKVNKNASQ